MQPEYNYDWSELAFGSKKPLSKLKATFVAAPREMSEKRLKQLVKEYLPQGNIIIGLAKEDYIAGFEGQPQFRTLPKTAVINIQKAVNAASPKHKIYTLDYFQREAKYILQKIDIPHILLVRGSWKHTFHTREEYYAIANRRLEYSYISPFANEQEARDYEATITQEWGIPTPPKSILTDADMAAQAAAIASHSYDYSFQTGVALGKPKKGGYALLATAYNKVVPFQTYAMHYGASREDNFTPPNDLNHYDTIHAEVALLIKAQKEKLDLRGTTLFINLLPCPACARMLCETEIDEFVYVYDHSNGYAYELLQKAGKKIRRLTT